MAKAKKTQPKQPAGAADPGSAASDPSQSLDADEEHQRIYKGASGQLAVMSEFLYRLINVAVPEVDVGDDVFVVREKDEAVTRVQVKYSKADPQRNNSYVTQFLLPWEQFNVLEDIPALVYVLAVRYKDRWSDFIVIRRALLQEIQAVHGIGSIAKQAGRSVGLKLRLVFTEQDVKATGNYSLQPYRNAFTPWPPLLSRASAGTSADK